MKVLRAGEGVRLVRDVLIPMRDGVRLAADLYVPDDGDGAGGSADLPAEPLPVVMEYLPYRKDEVDPSGTLRHYLELPRNGYILARVDIRGTGGSEGHAVDEYVAQEQEDGYDAIEWMAAQPWCDGHVNMIGISYGGFTALQVATLQPPHLTSIIPVDFTDDRYTDDCHYRGGLMRMYYDVGYYGTRMVAWNAMPTDPTFAAEGAREIWERHVAEDEPYLLAWFHHQVDGPYWRQGSVGDIADRIVCPTFLIGGWRDGYPNPPIRLFERLTGPKRLLIGPWDHRYPDAGIPGPGSTTCRDVVRWLDHWCRGRDDGIGGRAADRRVHAGSRVARARPDGECRALARGSGLAAGGRDRALVRARAGRSPVPRARDGPRRCRRSGRRSRARSARRRSVGRRHERAVVGRRPVRPDRRPASGRGAVADLDERAARGAAVDPRTRAGRPPRRLERRRPRRRRQPVRRRPRRRVAPRRQGHAQRHAPLVADRSAAAGAG